MTNILMSSSTTKARSTWRSVVLPTEHGAWGFLSEPILLGLLVAFSWAGVALGVAAFSIFLVQQPLKIALKDRLRGRTYPRTKLAARFAALFGALAVVSGGLALLSARQNFLAPLLIAVPLALLQVGYAARSQGRALIPEISGAWALGASAALIGLAGGLPAGTAFLLWAIMAARALISIMYVRVRLRRARRESARIAGALILHVAALLGFDLLWLMGVVGVALPIAFGVLLARAAKGLIAPVDVPTKVIGFMEMGYGVLIALLAAAAVG